MAHSIWTSCKKLFILCLCISETSLLSCKSTRQRINLVLFLNSFLTSKCPIIIGRSYLVRHDFIIIQQTLKYLFNSHGCDTFLFACELLNFLVCENLPLKTKTKTIHHQKKTYHYQIHLIVQTVSMKSSLRRTRFSSNDKPFLFDMIQTEHNNQSVNHKKKKKKKKKVFSCG